MRSTIKYALFVVAFHLFLPLFSHGQYNVVPQFQEVQAHEGTFKLTASSRIVVDAASHKALERDLMLFKKELRLLSGVELEVLEGEPQNGDLAFTLGASDEALGGEGYQMDIAGRVHVTANSAKGAFYAMQSLLQLFMQGKEIQNGHVRDFPKYAERGFMIDLGRRYFEVEYIETLIRRLAWVKINFIHLHLTEWNGFRLKSELFPGLAAERSYSKQDIRRIQDYAAKYHMIVIPEIDLPAHATALTDYNPYLAFKCPEMRASSWQTSALEYAGIPLENKAWVLDISRREVRSWIKALLDEWIPLFDGPYFHIGGDEYQYDKDKYACKELVEAAKEMGYEYPGDVFVDFVNELNEQIKSYGKTTIIWNWWRFCYTEDQINKTSIQPAKDIVIDGWISRTGRLKEILADGYKVVNTGDIMGKGGYLYVCPGGSKQWFFPKKTYEQWEPHTHPNLKGFKICLWTQMETVEEGMQDDWFDPFIDLPMAIFAERTWDVERDDSLEQFQNRLNKVAFPLYGEGCP